MTVIRPNSVSGINSITANGGDINLFRADGTKADIPIVNNITAGVVTATTFKGAIDATTGTFSGNLGVGGVLTYEDVTNIDSVGVITARDGLRVTGVTTITGTGEYLLQLNKSDSSAVYTQFTNSTSGTSTSDGFRIGMDSNEDGLVWLREDGNIKFGTDNSERLRIGGNGEIGIGGGNYGNSGQVLTSQGSGSAVQWATPSSGDYVKIQRGTNGYVASYIFDNLDVSTYKFFDFNAAFVPGNDGQYPYFRFRTGGASGADVTGSHYSYGYGESYPSNNYTQGSQSGHSQVTLSGTLGYNTNNGEGLRINMRIMFADANDNGSSGQLSNFITYQYIRVDASGDPRFGHGSAIYSENTTTYPTGFRLYMASGGINANSYGLYGMKR